MSEREQNAKLNKSIHEEAPNSCRYALNKFKRSETSRGRKHKRHLDP